MPIPAGITWTTADPQAPFSNAEVPTATKLSAIVSHIYDRQGDTTLGGFALTNVGNVTFAAGKEIHSVSRVGIGTATPLGGLHAISPAWWASLNLGASVVADGVRNNAVAILDYTHGNPLALANFNGDFQVLAAPALTDSTTAPTALLFVKRDGKVGIGTSDPKSKLHVVGLPSYVNNAGAVAAGLTAGAMYIVTGTNPAQVAIVT